MRLPSRAEARFIPVIVLGHLLLTAWSLRLVSPRDGISLIWLPDGFMMACLAILSLRAWPWLLGVGVLAVLGVEAVLTDRPPTMILTLVAANFGGATLGAVALRRFGGGRNGFTEFPQLGAFLLGCVAVVPAVSATLGTLGVTSHHPDLSFWSIYRTWFFATSTGVLFITPLVIFGHLRWLQRHPSTPGRRREHLLLLGLSLVGATMSSVLPPNSVAAAAILFASVPLLVWSAIRLGLWGASTVSAALVLSQMHWLAVGFGPFFDPSTNLSEGVLRLQTYFGSAVIATLFTALAVEKYARARTTTEQSLARYSAMFDHSPVALWEEDFSDVKRHLDAVRAGSDQDIESWLADHPEEAAHCASLVRIVAVNAHTLKLFEAPSLDALKSNLAAVFNDESLVAFRKELVAFASGVHTFRAEAEQKTLTGRTLLTATNVAIAPGFEDSWGRVLVAIEDVTERREADRVLRQAQKMEAVGQMSGGIAHDFNNILGVILGNLDLLDIEADLQGELREYLNASRRSAKRAASLTKQLLGFSRHQATHVEAIDLGHTLERMKALVEKTVTPAVRVDYDLPREACKVLVDAGELEDVLLNLVINAKDAMASSTGGTLSIGLCTRQVTTESLRPPLAPGGYVVLSVKDTGVGIPDEALDRIFEPFFTTKSKGKGTGLGLAMVYAFVKRASGRIDVESLPGDGTCFTIYLPEHRPNGLVRKSKSSSGETPLRGEGTILLVDDEDGVRRLTKTLLERLGYNVIASDNGPAALEALARLDTVHLLITDVIMPDMDGYTLAEHVRDRRPDLPILMTSGFIEPAPDDAPRPDYPVLAKPFRMHELARKVIEAIGPAS